MAHTYTNLLTHIVFSTKHRIPLIDRDLRPELFAYLAGIINNVNGKALKVNGTTDHAHLLVDLPAAVSVAEATRIVKANSSKWIHENWRSRRHFAWQQGYAAFSVSQSAKSRVIDYIARQEEHHSRFSFQDELRALLKKHRIEYDERFLWD